MTVLVQLIRKGQSSTLENKQQDATQQVMCTSQTWPLARMKQYKKHKLFK